jgi:hypothetical protein
MKIPSYKVIIAAYRENLEWTNKLKQENVIIYNKSDRIIENSIRIPNVGRDPQTFIQYVVDNYNSLPDYSIFVQGDPFPHMISDINSDNFQQHIEDLVHSNKIDILPLFCNFFCEPHGLRHGIKTHEYMSLFFNESPPNEVIFSAGCQYIVSKNNILHNPLQFYVKFNEMMLNSPIQNLCQAEHDPNNYFVDSINPWCVERLLYYIFSKSLTISNNML